MSAMDGTAENREKKFFVWLSNTVPSQVFTEAKKACTVINSVLVQRKAIPSPLFQTTQAEYIENTLKQVNRVFGGKKLRKTATNLLKAYIVYLKEIDNAQVTQPAAPDVEAQENWIYFDFKNARSFERTVPVYCNIGGSVIEGRNWTRILVAIVEHEISCGNPAVQALYKNPLYVCQAERPFLMEESIDGLYCSKLTNGYWINVNWNIPRIMEIIWTFCKHCGYSKEQVTLYGIPKGDTSAKQSTPPLGKNRSAFDMEKAEAYLRNVGLQGATVQELIDRVQPGAPIGPTKNVLDENMNVVAMPESRYIHVDSFVDLDEAADDFERILSTHFAQFGGYSNNQLLFVAASKELSMFLNDNNCESIDKVYAIARFLFEKRRVTGTPYKFYPPHIFESEPEYPMTLRGLMINLARVNGGILLATDAKDYLQKTMLTYGGLGQLLQIGTTNTFLMYDDNRYLLSETLGIDDTWCSQMHDKMDDLFRMANVAYVIPRDIKTAWLGTLPILPQGLQWTRLLLQEILDKYPSIGFKSISADITQSHHTLSAAFVPIDSPLQSFPDVVSLFMDEKYELPRRMSGEELRLELRDAGMLESDELIYALPKALDDYRFAWSNQNKTVCVLGNK